MADHLASLERQTGKRFRLAEEDVPAIPWPVQHVWNDFMTVTMRRTSNGFGANPLGYAELEAFARLMGRTFTPWEVRLMFRLDDLLVAALRPKSR
jgi:hypothetical protein